jgi:ATP sulfurylase
MKLLCTLGPATYKEEEIKKLTQLGVNLFRINLSHTKAEDLEEVIHFIRSYSDTPICLDSEGAQVRTGDFREKFYEVVTGDLLTIPKTKVLGEKLNFNLYPLDIVEQLDVGTLVNIDFNSVMTSVISKNKDGLVLKVLNGGVIGGNKAVTCDKEVLMDPLTEKDKIAMQIGKKMGIKNVALSFAHRASDVAAIREACLPGTKIISKIECLSGLKNLEAIIEATDEILIDRGDLSREVPIEQGPLWQKKIISTTNAAKKPVYVATNLLESMVSSPLPTRAEINDIFNTLQDGASGLVLAAETAIGRYPIECVSMIKKVMAIFASSKSTDFDLNKVSIIDFLPLPHGGKLVQQFIEFKEEHEDLPQITLPTELISDIEQIAHGTFSPLTGFMGKTDILSVLSNYKLKSGLTWTLPIVLQLDEETLNNKIGTHKEVVVLQEGVPHSILKIKDIFHFDIESQLQSWFGTNDSSHAGIQRLKVGGNLFVEADVWMFDKNKYQSHQISFTPQQLRTIFNKLGWSNVVGFHTRNVPHSAHEFIQDEALKRANSRALLISPVVGPKKSGDFETEVIFEGYEIAIKRRQTLKSNFLLSGFNTYSRYAGPREAVFTALCRKNMGCSFFIVGRDHTGLGQFYSATASQEIFNKIGPIDIEPLFFGEIAYNTKSQKYEQKMNDNDYQSISGTEVRKTLQSKKSLPDWFMKADVQELIKHKIQTSKKVFVD